ncbi:RelA/SpoT family protein [Actinacidiphila epipremni]|uniref:Bifunctional (P)ppGpp synthetase/guanosine-3',5'-bis(Diphosphate) 3'-pyrophosphohydrolase n=1 Tax=Actinacidiphila epipremni TaxID=2053013 RepID=A0ABX0ZYF6_9ACTN|nr:HD domain-containing protein [Actinacidiphila epipremni]NJP47546.1 bifunctional (p)ppGpp synthetase/guanosine-3',5'-bis(diphosphate) 3'-pyrophosphohydrolase [Actinacidiphila epipremni]
MSADNATDAGRVAEARRRGLLRIDLRRLGRAALLGPGTRDRLPGAIEHLIKVHRARHPHSGPEAIETLRRAYVLAESSHRGQTRKSGEPYITHPLAVTLILAELGAETTTLTASLLHDTVEDTEVTLDQVREEFGAEVTYLVDGVTKLEKVDYGAAAEPETFRKMLVATGSDVRVMAIKLADRLHNVRTLGVMRPDKQARIARVTRDVLIPLAERLGVQALKTELEDRVFAILHPAEYARTQAMIAANAERPDLLASIAEDLRAVLREADIPAEVAIRPRHAVSLHRLLLKRGGTELGSGDFGRLLVLVGEDADCYAVLGELHTCFTPVIAEFKDFIAAPKFNLYQSLHTAIADAQGRIAEVLVRTRQMHRIAEAGVIALGHRHAAAQRLRSSAGGPPPVPGAAARTAAHPSASGSRSAAEAWGTVDPSRPGWLARLLEWQRDAPDPDIFWTALRDDLAQDREITVFTADGDVTRPVRLPAGASCVDAAYAVHGEDGHRCIGVRVNGRLAPLGTRLRDGDSLQLLLDAGAAPRPGADWLEHAATPAARIAITRWLAGHPAPADDEQPAALPALRPAKPEAEPRPEQPVAVTDLPDATVRLARCCTPVPPDAVTGFVVRGGIVTVHRVECPTTARMTAAGRRSVPVGWRDGAQAGGYRATVLAEALSRPRLLADLTEAIAAEGVGIVSAAVEPPQELRVRHTYTVELTDPHALAGLMRAMRAVPGVYDVYRARPAVAAGSG